MRAGRRVVLQHTNKFWCLSPGVTRYATGSLQQGHGVHLLRASYQFKFVQSLSVHVCVCMDSVYVTVKEIAKFDCLRKEGVNSLTERILIFC